MAILCFTFDRHSLQTQEVKLKKNTHTLAMLLASLKATQANDVNQWRLQPIPQQSKQAKISLLKKIKQSMWIHSLLLNPRDITCSVL